MAASIELLANDAPAAVIEGAMEVLARCFSGSEPLDVTRGVTYDEWLPTARDAIEGLRGNGLALVARLPTPPDADERTLRESVLGLVLNCDGHDNTPEVRWPPEPKFGPILKVLDALDERACTPAAPHRDVYVWLLAVDSRARGQGLGAALLRETVRIAREQRYHSVVTEATSTFTRLICEKLGFVVESEVEYETFELPNGERPFAELPRITQEKGIGKHPSGAFLRLTL